MGAAALVVILLVAVVAAAAAVWWLSGGKAQSCVLKTPAGDGNLFVRWPIPAEEAGKDSCCAKLAHGEDCPGLADKPDVNVVFCADAAEPPWAAVDGKEQLPPLPDKPLSASGAALEAAQLNSSCWGWSTTWAESLQKADAPPSS